MSRLHSSERPMRFLPKTLTTRLVLTLVALVTLISVLVAVSSTVLMGGYLTRQLDQELGGVQDRAFHPAGRAPDDDGQGPRRGAFNPRTLIADLGSATLPSGTLSDQNTLVAISAEAKRELATVPDDGHAHTVDLDDLGGYRVLTSRQADGDLLAVGLPTDKIQMAEQKLLVGSLLLALVGVVLAGLVGRPLVRRQLRPLREVAATARDVTAMPLDSGGQTIETRVAQANTDPSTEVGRVGSALNTLLDHVDAALDARHRSEQQVRQFVADASHELRTPLSTIHGYAELSRRTPDDAAMLSSAMGKVETEATRMSSLVGDMLLLARLDSGRPLEREEVDLTRLLLEAVTDARVVAPDHKWRLDLPDEPVTVVGDELRLHQVVTNLINNARRHTPAGSTVTVGALERSGPGEPVTVTVHDDGPGISPDLTDHVFERFTRGDSSRTRASGGAGLGLSLVQAITEAHGGTARVESRPGSTTFTLTLP